MTELHLSGEFAEIFAAMASEGYLGQLPSHSTTSQYGQLSRFDALESDPLTDFFAE
jgi:ketol-acid reductoisomerase